MGLAFTNRPIHFATDADGSTVASLKAAIHAAATAVEWAAQDIAGGKLYTLTSPQGLGALLEVKDADDPAPLAGWIHLRFISLDGTKVGYPHRLQARSGRQYIIWANCCGILTGVPGVMSGDPTKYGYEMAGSIPYVAAEVSGECDNEFKPGTVSRCWWSGGDCRINATNGHGRIDGLRSIHKYRDYIEWPGAYSYCYGDDFYRAPFGTPYVYGSNAFRTDGAPELMRFTATGPQNPSESVMEVRKWDGTPLHLEPFIGWSKPSQYDGAPLVVGQLYDAAMVTERRAVDAEEIWDGMPWWNYSGRQADSSDWGASLMLLKKSAQPDGGGGGPYNYAF